MPSSGSSERLSWKWLLAVFFLFILWSNSFHAIAWLRPKTTAWSLVVLRFAPVGLFCALWLGIREPRESLAALRAHGGRILAMGILMVPVYNVALNWGQGQVPAGTASLLIALNPIFTYVIAMCIGQESPRWRKTAGLLLSLVAVYFLLRFEGRAFGGAYVVRALAVLSAPLSWALATVLGRPLVQRESPLRVTYLSLVVGSAPFMVWAALDPTIGSQASRFDLADWSALAHLSILCTIVGFAIWYAALRRLPASSVAAFVLLNPPFTVLFGPIWGSPPASWASLVFGAIVLSGVALAVTASGSPGTTGARSRIDPVVRS